MDGEIRQPTFADNISPIFYIGLAVFIIKVVLEMIGKHPWAWLQWAGIIFIVVGAVLTAINKR